LNRAERLRFQTFGAAIPELRVAEKPLDNGWCGAKTGKYELSHNRRLVFTAQRLVIADQAVKIAVHACNSGAGVKKTV